MPFLMMEPAMPAPGSDSLDETTGHSTRLQETAAKSLVIPQAGERTNEKGNVESPVEGANGRCASLSFFLADEDAVEVAPERHHLGSRTAQSAGDAGVARGRQPGDPHLLLASRAD